MRRVSAALIAVALALQLGPTTPAGGAEVARYELRRTTTFAGDDIAMAPVRLEQAATISTEVFDNPSVEVRSRGMFGGMILKQDVRRGGVEVMAVRVPLCPSERCRGYAQTTVTVLDPNGDPRAPEVRLPAGDYFVYLVTDGSPVEVELRLEGPNGSSTISPTAPATAAYEPLAPYVDVTQSGVAVAAAQTDHQIGSMGISIVGMWLTAKKHRFTEADACTNARIGGVDIPRPHTIACLGGSSWTVQYATEEIGPAKVMIMNYEFIDGGDWSRTVNYRTASDVEDAAAFEFFVDYQRGVRTAWISGLEWGVGN